MMTGILASSSAFRMHSSKNPVRAVGLRPSRPPRGPAPTPPPPPPPWEIRPLGTAPAKGAGPRATPPPEPTAQREPRAGDVPAAGVWASNSNPIYGSPNAHQTPFRAPRGLHSRRGRALGLGAGTRGRGLLFRWLTSARILSSFSLFRTLELSPCSRLRKAPSASRRRLSRSMRTFTSA